jgi:hypothetical protein
MLAANQRVEAHPGPVTSARVAAITTAMLLLRRWA